MCMTLLGTMRIVTWMMGSRTMMVNLTRMLTMVIASMPTFQYSRRHMTVGHLATLKPQSKHPHLQTQSLLQCCMLRSHWIWRSHIKCKLLSHLEECDHTYTSALSEKLPDDTDSTFFDQHTQPWISTMLSQSLPVLTNPDAHLLPTLPHKLTPKTMVELREQHQTREAWEGVKNRAPHISTKDSNEY